MLLRGLASASNGMNALIDMNDMTANNIANVNTVGFKKANLIFQNIYDANVVQKDQEGQAQEIGELSMGSRVQKVTYDFSQGAINKTGNPFDMAIEGDGFFKLQSPNGDITYTRNGSFALNNRSELVTKEGDYVLDSQNKKIKIAIDGLHLNTMNDIIVNEDGQIQISNENNQVMLQKIGIYDFQNKEDMTYLGSSKFKPTDATTNRELKSEKFTIQQGSIETSNANIVNEMISSINTSRNYESLSKVVKTSGDTLSAALKIGRIS